jgi:hypothetical protein
MQHQSQHLLPRGARAPMGFGGSTELSFPGATSGGRRMLPLGQARGRVASASGSCALTQRKVTQRVRASSATTMGDDGQAKRRMYCTRGKETYLQLDKDELLEILRELNPRMWLPPVTRFHHRHHLHTQSYLIDSTDRPAPCANIHPLPSTKFILLLPPTTNIVNHYAGGLVPRLRTKSR